MSANWPIYQITNAPIPTTPSSWAGPRMLLGIVFESMRQSQRTAGDRSAWTPGQKRPAAVSWRQMLVYLQVIVVVLKKFGFSPHPVREMVGYGGSGVCLFLFCICVSVVGMCVDTENFEHIFLLVGWRTREGNFASSDADCATGNARQLHGLGG